MLLRALRRVSSAPDSWQCRRFASFSGTTIMDNALKDGELRVFIVAGEASGDSIGSRLMASLKKLSPTPVRFSGVGGSMMSKQGLKSLFPMEDIAVMGILELLPHLNKIRVKLKDTIDAALAFHPHVVVTVDSKGFSFRLLKQLRAKKQLNSPEHFHYVAPSFWAWKGGESRLKNLASFVDHVFCILPFEETICRSNGLPATFVGHPILEDVLEFNLGKPTSSREWKIEGNGEDFLTKYAVKTGGTVISLLPGSRIQEVIRMLPIFADSMKQLKDSLHEITSVIHLAPNQHVEKYVRGFIHKWPVPCILIPGGQLDIKYDAFSASRVALCTSGTVALELQLARLPCVVAYRANLVTEWLIRYKAKIPYISLPNILMDSPIIPEALFQACTPTNLASLLMEVVQNKEVVEKQSVAAETVLRLVSPPQTGKNNLKKEGIDTNCTPSMLAASTILCYSKP